METPFDHLALPTLRRNWRSVAFAILTDAILWGIILYGAYKACYVWGGHQ